MSSKKELKKFCRLSKYIEQADPSLFNVFEDLCLTGYLKPRGPNGITFLFPKDTYRKEIINAAYSSDPTEAAAMLKSLILRDFYKGPESFGSVVVNALNQKINVDEATTSQVKLSGGLILKKDPKFVPLYHENMSVYVISGKGKISTKGEPAALIERKESKSGGGVQCGDKLELQKMIADQFIADKLNADSIYVKKVAIQLFLINKERAAGSLPGKLDILKFLGNDEFSDSYLLDMYCASECPYMFKQISEVISNKDEQFMNATRAKYVEHKTNAIGSDSSGSASQYSDRIQSIRSPLDIRQKLKEYYGDDSERFGKDLFIVFCNICRDLWQTESALDDKVKSFENFAYLTSQVYQDSCVDILKQDFDIARDLTLYGNLLKSDVFLYAPKATFGPSTVKSLPSPLDMSLYSLCSFINQVPETPVSGGGSYDPRILDGF